MLTINQKDPLEISPLPYMTRYDVVERLLGHGWDVQFQDGLPPAFKITGPWPGVCGINLPENPDENHAPLLQEIYYVWGVTMTDLFGYFGRC